MTTSLTVIYEKGESGWWIATVPEISGAFSQGQTKEEAKEMVLDLIEELMAARRELALKEAAPGVEIENIPLAS